MESFRFLVNSFLLQKVQPGLIFIAVLCLLLIVVAVILSNNYIKKGVKNAESASVDNDKMLNSDNSD